MSNLKIGQELSLPGVWMFLNLMLSKSHTKKVVMQKHRLVTAHMWYITTPKRVIYKLQFTSIKLHYHLIE
jgi:hypothetical protein